MADNELTLQQTGNDAAWRLQRAQVAQPGQNPLLNPSIALSKWTKTPLCAPPTLGDTLPDSGTPLRAQGTDLSAPGTYPPRARIGRGATADKGDRRSQQRG